MSSTNTSLPARRWWSWPTSPRRSDRSVSFATVVEAARRRGEVAIGYRSSALSSDAGASYGVKVNPPKADKVKFGEGDRVIVLAEG